MNIVWNFLFVYLRFVEFWHKTSVITTSTFWSPYFFNFDPLIQLLTTLLLFSGHYDFSTIQHFQILSTYNCFGHPRLFDHHMTFLFFWTKATFLISWPPQRLQNSSSTNFNGTAINETLLSYVHLGGLNPQILAKNYPKYWYYGNNFSKCCQLLFDYSFWINTIMPWPKCILWLFRITERSTLRSYFHNTNILGIFWPKFGDLTPRDDPINCCHLLFAN
jgi:hypothetical protein